MWPLRFADRTDAAALESARIHQRMLPATNAFVHRLEVAGNYDDKARRRDFDNVELVSAASTTS